MAGSPRGVGAAPRMGWARHPGQPRPPFPGLQPPPGLVTPSSTNALIIACRSHQTVVRTPEEHSDLKAEGLSMKFLLELIQSQSHDASELLAISTDARESGLRDEKATIHEFIDTLERITNELRSDPNATAFLSKVRKTDAPDYYDVIKKPMDLGTVLKKVRAGGYKTKSAFNDDLELIWSNCLTYNQDMNHHLRAAAESLRKKAQDLLKFVSEPSLNRPTPNGTSQLASRPAAPTVPTPSSPSTNQNLPLLGLKLAEERWRKTERGRATITEDTQIESDNIPTSPHLEPHKPIINPQNNFATSTSQSEVRFEKRKALVRDPERMWNWFESREDEPFEMVESDLLMTGLPALPFASRSNPKPRERNKDKKKGKQKQQTDTEEGLKKPISTNVKTLWEIKKVYRKLSDLLMGNPLRCDTGTEPVIEEDERTKPIGSDENESDEEEEDEPQPAKFFKNLPPAEVYDTCLAKSAAQNAMFQIISMMIAHVGFDASHTGALHCLTEIAIQYLCNIGRTLHFFADRFSPMLSASEMIYQTLRANGVGGLDELESYVKDDVDKYGNKLSDLLRKLQAGYGNGLAGTAAKVIGDEDFFSRDGEALMTGEFTTELGEDFFGLRDIGLDSELGLSSLRIPSRLFHGRPKADPDQASAQEAEDQPTPEPRFVKPPEFIPLQPEWIEEQIGLLQPIYKARLETKDFKLKDDDQVARLPKIIRPKVPPSGKIPIKRRAAPASQANNHTSDPAPSVNKKVKLDTASQAQPTSQTLNNSSTLGHTSNHATNGDVVMK
ncbi:hypothetical protein PCASD_08451 [Puccinia coronata f. sp. avenae]|uniref:Bromo domain-containing protein n=1 Tax=Puccinia coronata f. sp. avenae TaxID=200324 RepID=A0A2N5UMJ4_9BASI|nr:hypothetical protein PCASD_08451 [Puccinia coronata f. sp. avenae]